MKQYRNAVAAAILSFGIATSGFLVAHALEKSRLLGRSVDVKGLSERLVKSDQASLQLSFVVSNDSLSGLYDDMAKAQKTITTFLEQQGFRKQEIALQPTNVTDNQSQSYSNNPNMKHYRADTSVIATTQNVPLVTTAQQATGALVKAGIVVTSSLSNYAYTQLNSIKTEMLNEATRNAREAAQTFAENSDSKVGNIQSASQGQFTISEMQDGISNGEIKKVRVVTTVKYTLQ